MEQEKIVKELENIADKLIIQKKFQTNLKEVFVRKCLKFINNEDTTEGREKLLAIIKEVSWFNISDVNIFFQIAICNIIDEIENNYYLIYEKNRPESSNHQIISSLALNCGITEENCIPYHKKETKLEKKAISKSVILIVDDYSGSGNTIENIVDKIEEDYFENEIYIVVYIWQEKALETIKNKIEQKDLKNVYHIYKDEETKIETDYKGKFQKQAEIQEIIETICQGCKNDEYRFGHNETGAMLSINGVSPNNNISMLWRKDIIYKEMVWSGLLNRDLCWEALDAKKRKIIKKGHILNERYESNQYVCKKLTREEFQLMMYVFNEYTLNIEYLRKIMGYDTEEEVEEKIKKLEKQNVLTFINHTIIFFKDKEIIKELKRIDKKIMQELIEKKENRNIA